MAEAASREIKQDPRAPAPDGWNAVVNEVVGVCFRRLPEGARQTATAGWPDGLTTAVLEFWNKVWTDLLFGRIAAYAAVPDYGWEKLESGVWAHRRFEGPPTLVQMLPPRGNLWVQPFFEHGFLDRTYGSNEPKEEAEAVTPDADEPTAFPKKTASGVLRFDDLDRPALDYMHKLITEGDARTPNQAANIAVAGMTVPGHGTPESRAKRLAKSYRKRFGSASR